MKWLLDDLNDAQRDAVVTTEGPLLIVAGAGSGKTRVLTRRLAYLLVQQKATPAELLAVTFTNKAAGEMKERVRTLMGSDIPELQVSTFHSFGARFLRREARALGYAQSFTIFDDDDSLSLMKRCLKELGISDAQFPPKGLLRKISEAKNALIDDAAYAQQAVGYFAARTADAYHLYAKRLRECQAMDFDDLLFYTVRLLADDPAIGERYRQRFRYLLVDEYQDTNHVQYLLLKNLLGSHHNLCVVGDEDQSIYGWRGADIRNILEFEHDFPGAKVIKLEQNYRSTMNILRAAGSVIANNTARKAKELWTSAGAGDPITLLYTDNADEEAIQVVRQIASLRSGTPLRQMAILYRTNAQSRPFEEHLRRHSLPYQVVGGQSFYQRKEIKDLVAYLKLLVNLKDDVSFERIINYPRRGIGDKTITEITGIARREQRAAYEVACDASGYPALAGKLARLRPFVELIESYRQRAETTRVDSLVMDLVTDLKLLEELRDEDPVTGDLRVENIEAFIEGTADYARSHPEPRLAAYLQEVSLLTNLDEYKQIEDKVTLMTIHAAKGLEFDLVCVVGLEEGRFPMQRALIDPAQLEEERRLFYVAATRARKYVLLSLASERFQFGEVSGMPSRFIGEIPKDLIVALDRRTYRRVAGEPVILSSTPATVSIPGNGSGSRERVYEFEEHAHFKPGRVVAHPTFGRGRIMAVEGYGDTLCLQIAFTGAGVKKIMARYAKLKVIG